MSAYGARELGWECVHLSTSPSAEIEGIRNVCYPLRGTANESVHPLARDFELKVRHAAGVAEAGAQLARTWRPDVVVGHSGLGNILYLRDVFPSARFVTYFEYYYSTGVEEATEDPDEDIQRALHARSRNAMTHLEFDACDAGYTPTLFQHGLFPPRFRAGIEVIHDGVPTDFWAPDSTRPARIGELPIDAGTRVLTYCSRGFESLRGFDTFIEVAARTLAAHDDLVVLVVGEDEVCYGDDRLRTGGRGFKEWLLEQRSDDLSRLHFLGKLSARDLRDVMRRSDCHVYLTAPFVLSWSLLDAMSCAAPIVASDTEPVREVIEHGVHGWLEGFRDIDALTERVLAVLSDGARARECGRAARERVIERYAESVVHPRLARHIIG
ncbi:MAG: glycosyltransferase [Myxococcota bacterium]